MNLINRKRYLDKLIEYTNKDFIKVLVGVRRVGKSSILALYKDYLEKNNEMDSVLSINFDNPEYLFVSSASILADLLKSKVTEKTKYILLDEVQLIPGWERVVNACFATKRYDLTITGSNAAMLSSELATYLTGRYVEINVLPLSYNEFLTFKGETSSSKLFEEYISFGGLPAIVLLEGSDNKRAILNSIYDSILYNDIVKRCKNINPAIIDCLVMLLNDSIGFPVSINKITNTMKSKGYKVYFELLSDYIKALKEAELFYPVQFCFIKGRERFGVIDKYYSVDTGFINLTKSMLSENYGSLLENIVYLELKRRGYEISVGREDSLEVDFVAKRNNEISYYQVSESILDSNTRDKEFNSLSSIADNWSKTILSMDTHDYSRNGIKCKNIIDFLLEE